MSHDIKIPKRHALRHYMKKVCELYGESPENTATYIEEQLKANDHQLDKAIECFQGLLADGKKV